MSRNTKSQRQSPRRTADRLQSARLAGPIEPVVIDTSEYVEAEPVHIFTIDEIDYFMPGEPSPALALRVLEMAELRGDEAATSYMLAEMLGEESHTALKNCDKIRPAQMEAIIEIVSSHMMGSMQGN